MKQPALLITIIVGSTMIVCTAIASSALKSVGQSIEDAARSMQLGNVSIPNHLTLRTPDLGRVELRLSNGGGGGESLRIASELQMVAGSKR
jgi:hypothetical protein